MLRIGAFIGACALTYFSVMGMAGGNAAWFLGIPLIMILETYAYTEE
jgi:hypothetical protein